MIPVLAPAHPLLGLASAYCRNHEHGMMCLVYAVPVW